LLLTAAGLQDKYKNGFMHV
jgi:hypothetical protein